MNKLESQATLSLALLFAIRMFGLFILLPILAVLGTDLKEATPSLIGFAIGVYGLTQACLQIPFGTLSDKWGRKPLILLGLALFITGSLVAAVSTSIWGMILGRALQGSGAIGGIIIALVSDVTRVEVRTKAMAIIGGSIGFSFLLALIIGPVLATSLGLHGIFYLVALLGIAGFLLAFFIIPGQWQPSQSFRLMAIKSSLNYSAIDAIKDPQLIRLNISIFLLHLLLTTIFIAVPPLLVNTHQMVLDEHWQLYLPVMLLSFLTVIPCIIFAEKKGKVRPVMLTMIGLLMLSSLMMHFGYQSFTQLAIALFLFFSGFNALEATLPSLVSKIAPAGHRGVCMSTYSTFQFMGSFAGGALGGMLYQAFDFEGIMLFAGLVSGLWLLIIFSFAAPAHLKSYSVTIANIDIDLKKFEHHILLLPGVREVFINIGEQVAYLKVDNRKFDPAFLDDLKLFGGTATGPTNYESNLS